MKCMGQLSLLTVLSGLILANISNHQRAPHCITLRNNLDVRCAVTGAGAPVPAVIELPYCVSWHAPDNLLQANGLALGILPPTQRPLAPELMQGSALVYRVATKTGL